MTTMTHGPVIGVQAHFLYRFEHGLFTLEAGAIRPRPVKVEMDPDTFEDLTDEGRPDHDLLERAFEVLNITDHRRPYSLSVGDEVEVWRETPTHLTMRRWRCDPLGWTLVDFYHHERRAT